jgi:ribonuclease VapC
LAKVFDSSAVLAFLYNETGGDAIIADLPDGLISAVNAAEVLAVLVRNEVPIREAMLVLQKTHLKVVEFGMNHAIQTARMLGPEFRKLGISLGDRACMATAIVEEMPAVTADRVWSAVQMSGLQVECIRD